MTARHGLGLASTFPRIARRRAALAVILGVVLVIGAVGGFAFVALPLVPAALPAPKYDEVARAAGIDHRYEGDFAYFVGGGVAAFDCNDDGRPDLYLAGGSDPAAMYRNDSTVGGSLRFARISDAATDLTGVTGAYPIDIDSDGRIDLAVLRFGENVLLRGLGDCRFERANEAWGFDGGDRYTTAFSATWEGSAALPTLAFGNYLVDTEHFDPNHLCADNALVRPDASRERYAPPIALTPAWCALSMLFTDWDRSGHQDLRVSNDRQYYSDLSDGQEQLWHVVAGETPRLYGEQDGWQPLRIWGMSIASYDLTGDGYPDYFLSSQGANSLQTLTGGSTRPDFQDIADRRDSFADRPFVGDTTLPSTAWHSQFEDVNNDGLIDLFIAKGNVDEQSDYAIKDPTNLLMGRPDGTFVEGAGDAGLVNFTRGRGAALVDLNLDGLLDIVKVNRRADVEVWQNVGAGDASSPRPMGHWVALRLQQPGSNRDAIGAWLEVKVGDEIMQREVTIGGGTESGQLGWIHFGLGASARAEIRVQWPDGEVGPWQSLPADGFAIVERGSDAVRPWTPGAD